MVSSNDVTALTVALSPSRDGGFELSLTAPEYSHTHGIWLSADEVAALRAHFVGTPRTVTTVEELNWLPPGSIVRWKSGIAGQRDVFDRFKSTNGNLQPIRHCGMFLPATVLYVPSEGVES